MKERRRSKHTGETPSAFYFQPKERRTIYTKLYQTEREEEKKVDISKKKGKKSDSDIKAKERQSYKGIR
jgi:hypothetical protein